MRRLFYNLEAFFNSKNITALCSPIVKQTMSSTASSCSSNLLKGDAKMLSFSSTYCDCFGFSLIERFLFIISCYLNGLFLTRATFFVTVNVNQFMGLVQNLGRDFQNLWFQKTLITFIIEVFAHRIKFADYVENLWPLHRFVKLYDCAAFSIHAKNFEVSF